MEKLKEFVKKEKLLIVVLLCCLGVSVYALMNIQNVEKELEAKWMEQLSICQMKCGYETKNNFYINLDDINDSNAKRYESVEEGLEDLK